MRLCLAPAVDDRAIELLAAIGADAESAGATVVQGGAEGGCGIGLEADDVTLFTPFEGTDPRTGEIGDPRRTIVLCTDFPGSDSFDGATALAAVSGGALGLSETAVLEQRRRGVASRRFELGLSERWKVSGSPRPSLRPRDVLFVGSHAPRRERLLACNARSLAQLRADIRLGSVWPGSRPLPSGATRRELFASTAIVLDIHPRRPHTLDRVLALEAIGAGALPVSECGLEVDPLVPGEHLEMVHGAQLGLVAAGLVRDFERLDGMAADAAAFAEAELSPRPAIERLLALAEGVAGRASSHARWRRRRRGGISSARVCEERAPDSPNGSFDGLAAARKRALLAGIESNARSRAAVLRDRGLDGELRCEFQSPAWEDRPGCRVAVCVPVHDDGDLALNALDSVVASTGVDIELLVADDASIDGSLDRLRGWLRQRPHLPSRLMASAVNRGVGAVRNAMLANARAPFAFMLDADNLLFPKGLERLVAALEREPQAAFAYGLLERCCDGRSVGLLSADPWEPERLRDGNYIDAMALLRRGPVLEAGGYVEDRRLYGWEDFDLWCRLAERGEAGLFVPEFVGRYRERQDSMLSVAEIDSSDAVAFLRQRSPRLSPSIPAVDEIAS